MGSLPVLCAHSFAINWQLLFLNQQRRENGRRNDFMTKSPRKNVPDVGIELGAACMPSGHTSDRATAPGWRGLLWLMQFTSKGTGLLNSKRWRQRHLSSSLYRKLSKDMMHKHMEEVKYGETGSLDCTALKLPYEGEELSMLILLPNKKDGTYFLFSCKRKMFTHEIAWTIHQWKEKNVNVLRHMGPNIGERRIFC